MTTLPSRPTRPPRAPQSRQRSRAFALALVMMLSFVAAGILMILIERQGEARLAVARQIDGYREHHLRAGLRQISQAFFSFIPTDADKVFKGGVIGYDITVSAPTYSSRIKVQLTDVQGTLREATVDQGRELNEIYNHAADMLRSRAGLPPVDLNLAQIGADGKLQPAFPRMAVPSSQLPRVATVGGAGPTNFFRERGPAAVSLNSASREVLETLVAAIDPTGTGAAFADAVFQRRADKRLRAADVGGLLTSSGLPQEKQALLAAMVSAEPSLWYMTATTVSSLGTITDRQGGLVTGNVKIVDAPGSGASASPEGNNRTNASTAAAQASSVNSGWRVLTWGAIDEQTERELSRSGPSGSTRSKQ